MKRGVHSLYLQNFALRQILHHNRE